MSLRAANNAGTVQNRSSAVARNLKFDVSQCRSNLTVSVGYEGGDCTSGRATVIGVEDVSNISAPVASVAVFMDGNAVALVGIQATQVNLDIDSPVT